MLITNATLVTWETPNRVLENHALLIEGKKIRDLGPSQKLEGSYPKSKKLDAHGQIVMPGGICAHTHFYSAFSRGMAIPGAAPKDFPEILEKLWWPLDKSLLEEDICYSALLSLIDAIKHGTTTLVDHHASPNAIDGSLDIIAEAVDKSGLRGVLCYEVTDRDGPDKAAAGIKENLRFINRLTANPHSRLAATFGLHASLTLSGATLQACRAAVPEGTGFHIHAANLMPTNGTASTNPGCVSLTDCSNMRFSDQKPSPLIASTLTRAKWKSWRIQEHGFHTSRVQT